LINDALPSHLTPSVANQAARFPTHRCRSLYQPDLNRMVGKMSQLPPLHGCLIDAIRVPGPPENPAWDKSLSATHPSVSDRRSPDRGALIRELRSSYSTVLVRGTVDLGNAKLEVTQVLWLLRCGLRGPCNCSIWILPCEWEVEHRRLGRQGLRVCSSPAALSSQASLSKQG
jgi:hypothetical protein